ncbi:hypothetical protein D3C87_1717650 [compost metagenome]
MFVSSNPQLVTIGHHAVEVAVGNAAGAAVGQKGLELAGPGIEPVQARVLCTDPQMAVFVFRDFVYNAAANAVAGFGKEFAEVVELG